MATATLNPEMTPAPAPFESMKGDQRVEFFGIGWAGYEALLEIQGEKARPQINYLDRNAYLTATSYSHEWLVNRLNQLILEAAVGLDLPFIMVGETTLSRRSKRCGVQPDESYYFANSGLIGAKAGNSNLDLRVDPSPDLSVVVALHQNTMAAMEALRRLGVPELWVGDEEGLRIMARLKNSRYREAERSLTLPTLTAAEIFEWVTRPGMSSMTQWVKEFRRWVQDVLVPRVRG
jgi:hypothetical protein